jgi:hypothetical protein
VEWLEKLDNLRHETEMRLGVGSTADTIIECARAATAAALADS